MQILDEDMETIRDWLNKSGAPEYVKEHFENLLTKYEKAEAALEEVESENKTLREEESERYQKLQEEYETLENEQQAEMDDLTRGALETVKYWLLDVLVHGRPMQKTPREVLRIVEEAL